MENTYGYIRTSRQRIAGEAGSDPEAQALQLHDAGVALGDIYRDVGVSGSIGTNSRAGRHALNARLIAGDTLVVAAIDRIGRRWMDTVNTVRDLRVRGVKIKSLSAAEASWASCLAADPGTPEAFLADTLLSFMAWASEQGLEATRRRTVAGLSKARVEGKVLGPPRKLDPDQVETARRLRREKVSLREIGRQFRVSASTVDRYLKEELES